MWAISYEFKNPGHNLDLLHADFQRALTRGGFDYNEGLKVHTSYMTGPSVMCRIFTLVSEVRSIPAIEHFLTRFQLYRISEVNDFTSLICGSPNLDVPEALKGSLNV